MEMTNTGRGRVRARHRAGGAAGPGLSGDGSLPNVVDLFNAHLADEQDLRTLPPAAASRSVVKRGRSAQATTKRPRSGAGPSRERDASGAAERGIFLVLDESEVATRAVAYVGRLVGRRRGFRVCVSYVLPELPSSLLEHGGAADPRAEERLAASLRAEQRRWVAARKREARGALDAAFASLRRAGLSSSALSRRFCGPAGPAGAADEILALAAANRCRTVVVGRRRLSWFGHLFTENLREELVRRAGRIAIWGIG
jgi:hypothetical protein